MKEPGIESASAFATRVLPKWAIIAFLWCVACGCQTSGKQDQRSTETKKDRGHHYDPVEAEETRAISNILFGIAVPEFQTQLRIFLEKSLKLDSIDKSGGKFYNHAIGNYIFSSVHPSFHQNKLYKIDIQGKYVGYEKYTAEIPHQKEVLDKMLTKWFGAPEFNYPLREWYHTEHNHRYESGRWRAGRKVIETYISNRGHQYTYDLSILLPEVETLRGGPEGEVAK
ncbi:hypothetical protein [Dyadobacter sp. 676]|uniref:Uncharacterized protein n=1 Tax=Dyadobacter sp. 676 TaxID=3088362 RepID=A0AAU8FIW9_9BACT